MEQSQQCLICAPLIATTVKEMLFQLQLAKDSGADAAELRVDHIIGFNPEVDLPELLNNRPLPVIVTPRAKFEGGLFEGSEESRQALLQRAYDLGADYIDVELKVAKEFIEKVKSISVKSSTKIIVSNHNWEFTPSQEEIDATIDQMWAAGGDIVKYVTTAQDITDVSRVFHFLKEAKRPTIGLAMGQTGMISRLLAPKFGGYLTFGALCKGQESAPGQPTVQDLIEVYRVKSMNQDTVVCGVIGKPIYHSKSPILHNKGYSELNLNYVYLPLLVDDFNKFMSVYSDPDFRAFSVTLPYKEDALRLSDEVDHVTKGIGAANTLVREENGKFHGYNTDCDGALSAIEDGLRLSGLATTSEAPLKDKLFVVIGAGGAGKALAYGAKERGARVAIANRNFERAKTLAKAVGGEAIELHKLSDFRPETGMILANSTSIGMQPEITKSPITKDALSAYALVFDAVYTPKETQLLKDAMEVGAVTVSGEEMFLRQAFAQFKLFTGQSPPESPMRDVILKQTIPYKGTLPTPVSARCSVGMYKRRGMRVSHSTVVPCQRGWSFSRSASFGVLLERSQVQVGGTALRF
jgi:3-dehydroquinate dehydratase/shikimate dehydrogenase